MICERGGCPGSGGKQPDPIYALVLMLGVLALLLSVYFWSHAGSRRAGAAIFQSFDVSRLASGLAEFRQRG